MSAAVIMKGILVRLLGSSQQGRQGGLPIIVYGVMTDNQGRPIAVDVYAGNTGDPSTVKRSG